jgi:hypothetical protein
VLDDPSWFQLLSSLDGRAFLSTATSVQTINKANDQDKSKAVVPKQPEGSIWILDADILRRSLAEELTRIKEGERNVSVEILRILEALAAEENDVVAWIGKDGILALRSIMVSNLVVPACWKISG